MCLHCTARVRCIQTDRRTVAQKRSKNERTNETKRMTEQGERSGERDRERALGVADGIIFGRRANFHSAVNRPRAEAEKLVSGIRRK